MIDRSLQHALLAMAVLWTGCSSSLDRYICSTNEDCQDRDSSGRCEATGTCSFVDPDCDSERRYGEAAGSDSNACVDVNGMLDAGTDANGDGCEWGLGFDMLNIGPCGPGVDPSKELVLGFASFLNTTTGVWQRAGSEVEFNYTIMEQSDGTELFVVATNRFESPLFSSLAIVGHRPLVIIAKESIVIHGSVSVSATGSANGAGAGSSCSQGEGEPGLDNGGGGGGFATAGANGGASDDGSTTAGGAENRTDLVPLRGGCPGGETDGDGGGGGGAIQLVAGAEISISGLLVAGGGGGGGGEQADFTLTGGAGGGSGGAILLQTREISADSGSLIVSGGGGGGGGGGSSEGEAGQDAHSAVVANGGSGGEPESRRGGGGTGGGGRGGDGATNNSGAMAGGDATVATNVTSGGGGGGGGGLGVIRTKLEP